MQPLALPLVVGIKNGLSDASSDSSQTLRTAGPAMPSSPCDLKPAHISPSPPASVSSSNSHISSSTISNQKVTAQTTNGVHSPNTAATNIQNGGPIPLSTTPSPPTTQVSIIVTPNSTATNLNLKTSTSTTNTATTTHLVPATVSELSYSPTSSKLRQISKLKRFLTTLYQFTCDISAEVGERVQSLIIGLVNSALTVEEFHQKIQETTHYPLRPYVVPFLKLHLPALQNEIMHVARLSKLTPAQFIRQNESFVLDVLPQNSMNGAAEPFEIFQPQDSSAVKEAVKRKPSPDLRRESYTECTEKNDVPPPTKRHQPNPSPTIPSRLSPGSITPTLLHNHSGNPSILHSHLSSARASMLEEAHRERENSSNAGLYHIPTALRDGLTNGRIHTSAADHFSERFSGIADRYEKDLFTRQNATMYPELHRNYNEDVVRDMEDEWKNIYTMLNCILGMVEKTKRALAILQQRSMEYASSSSLWPQSISFRGRHFTTTLDSSHPDYHEIKKPREQLLPTIQFSKPVDVDRISSLSDSIRRTRPQTSTQIEEAVNEVKRQAVAELQKAVSAAETKASELVAAERAKMERILSEARRHAAEDVLAVMGHQEDSNENCWNCGRKATETCSGCNIARYCGAFCQHKDWENHHRICGQNREIASNNTNASINSAVIPTTITDLKRSKGRSPTPPSLATQSSNANPRTIVPNGEREKSSD